MTTQRPHEFMPELFTRSELLIWNFDEIAEQDDYKNIQRYMLEQERKGKDAGDAFHRQTFNKYVLQNTGSRYLIGRYGEDRRHILSGSHIAAEGRTFHLAIDIFSQDQETVFAPYNGQIVVSSYEPGLHNYGNYLILKPDDNIPYIFFGHLAQDKIGIGRVKAGQRIARLGSYKDLENGGWSIHLHLQLLTEIPPDGEAPIGYSTLKELGENQKRYPDPLTIFPDWHIAR